MRFPTASAVRCGLKEPGLCRAKSDATHHERKWRTAGVFAGDRVEHGAVVPPELAQHLPARRLTVVTQPSLVAARGDEYLDEVEPEDLRISGRSGAC